MSRADVIKQALKLKSFDRYLVIEILQQSLDKPDQEIDKIWAEEAMRRLKACDEGRMSLHSFEEVFGKD